MVQQYEQHLEQVRQFWQGKGRYIISVYSSRHQYRQIFDDALMLKKVPDHLMASAQLPGVQLPSLYPDWGTISTAKYWGGQPRFDSTGGHIFIDPVAQTIDQALALKPRSAADPTQDGFHAVQLYQQLTTQLSTDALWLRSPDMQGTLNTARWICLIHPTGSNIPAGQKPEFSPVAIT